MLSRSLMPCPCLRLLLCLCLKSTLLSLRILQQGPAKYKYRCKNTNTIAQIQTQKRKYKKCTHRASSGWCRGPQSTGYSNCSRTHLPASQESGLPPPPPSYVVSQDLQPLLLLLLMISPKDLEKLPSEKMDFISKNTIRDGGSTVLYDAYIVDTVDMVYTALF